MFLADIVILFFLEIFIVSIAGPEEVVYDNWNLFAHWLENFFAAMLERIVVLKVKLDLPCAFDGYSALFRKLVSGRIIMGRVLVAALKGFEGASAI